MNAKSRKTGQHSAEKISELAEPVIISRIKIYRDGGTIGIELQGRKGGKFLCAVDRAARSDTRNHLYIGAIYPEEGSRVIPKGDAEEENILRGLQKIMDRDFSREEQSKLDGAYGRRKLTEKERKTALCLAAINHLRFD